MSPSRLKHNLDMLRVLQKVPAKQRKALLSSATSDLVLCIAEIVDNVLCGNVKITNKQCTQLKKYKKVLCDLANKKISVSAKRKLLTQKGGFLSALLGPAIGIISSLFGK